MLELKANFKQADQAIANLTAKHMPFAISRAMRFGLQSGKKAVVGAMPKYIEGGPTRWTKQGMTTDKPTKRNLVARLKFKSDRSYMQEVMHGGVKQATNRKLPEPILKNIKSGAELNKFGNIPRSLYAKAKAETNSRYFMGTPKGKPKNGKYNGIWRRRGKAGYYKNGRAKGSLEMVVSFNRSSRQQRATFPATKIGLKAFDTTMKRHFSKILRQAIASDNKNTVKFD